MSFCLSPPPPLKCSTWLQVCFRQHGPHEDTEVQPGPEEAVFTLSAVVLRYNVPLTVSQQHPESWNPPLLWRPCFTAVVRCRSCWYPGTLPRLCVSGQNVQTGQDLLRCLSQHALHVTDKAVDVAFARRLVDDVLVVVVTQATAQLLVVHLGFVLALAPALGHL